MFKVSCLFDSKFYEEILDPKKKSPSHGANLELEKGDAPCNCRELVIIIIFVV